jgi:hypothetical protein
VADNGKRCTVGIRYIRIRYDYSDQCPNEATGTGPLPGLVPRCEQHKARRYLVTLGTSIFLTKNTHDQERDARDEALRRLPSHLTRYPRAEAMRARPATATDIERFEAIASQTLDSVTVVGPPSKLTHTPGIGGNRDAQGNGDSCHGGSAVHGSGSGRS